MGYFNKIIEIIISLQIILISTFIPVYVFIPFTDNFMRTFEIPISWQIPSIIVITLLFDGKIVITAFTIYLVMGLFFLPVFHHGGSLGYLLTPNFGYLLGTYPLIKIIDNLNKINKKINYFQLLKYGIFGIFSMHLIGIIYSFVQMIYFKQPEIFLYNIAKNSIGKFGYHLLMLTPITLLIKIVNNKRYQN